MGRASPATHHTMGAKAISGQANSRAAAHDPAADLGVSYRVWLDLHVRHAQRFLIVVAYALVFLEARMGGALARAPVCGTCLIIGSTFVSKAMIAGASYSEREFGARVWCGLALLYASVPVIDHASSYFAMLDVRTDRLLATAGLRVSLSFFAGVSHAMQPLPTQIVLLVSMLYGAILALRFALLWRTTSESFDTLLHGCLPEAIVGLGTVTIAILAERRVVWPLWAEREQQARRLRWQQEQLNSLGTAPSVTTVWRSSPCFDPPPLPPPSSSPSASRGWVSAADERYRRALHALLYMLAGQHALPAEMRPSLSRKPDGWVRGMQAGVLLLICGMTLWLFDEFIAPHRVLPDWLSFLGSRGPTAWIFSSVAIAGFPVSGLAVSPHPPAAVRTLVHMWMWASLLLALLFTALTLLAGLCMALGADAPYNPAQAPLFATLACLLFAFCRSMRHGARTLHAAPAQLLEYTWRSGHKTGLLLAFIFCVHLCIRWLADRSYAAHISPAVVVLPLAPLLYVLGTTSKRRESLLRFLAVLDTPNDLDSQFDTWLHTKLSRFDTAVLSLLTLYWALQSWLSQYHPIELMATVCLSVLLCFRRAQPSKRDGEAWSLCLVLWQAAEAGSIAFGSAGWVHPITSPRLAHREAAFTASMLIGLMHGTQPISVRLRRWTCALIECLYLLWLAPAVFSNFQSSARASKEASHHPHPSPHHPPHHHPHHHPCWLPSGELNEAYLLLVGGCCISFALGTGVVQLFVHSTLKPLWTSRRVAETDHQRLAADKARLHAEKDRLYFDWLLAQREVLRLRCATKPDEAHRDESDSFDEAHRDESDTFTYGTCSELDACGSDWEETGPNQPPRLPGAAAGR